MKIRYVTLSEIGLKRKENQDAVFCADNGPDGIFLVADGMGGHAEGARASAVIKGKLETWWMRYTGRKERSSIFQVMEEIQDILADANREILENTEKGEICGSTAVVLWVQGSDWAVFSCGDSRCYQVFQGRLTAHVRRLTTDDVWENQQKNVRGLSQEEVREHVNFGRLTRAVGTEEGFSCTVQSGQLEKTGLFALCSDGIYKYCPERYFKRALQKAGRTERLETCMEEVRNAVYQSGAPDNLSLILIYVPV